MIEVPKVALLTDFSFSHSRILLGITKYCRLHPHAFHGEIFYNALDSIKKMSFAQLKEQNTKGIIIADVPVSAKLIEELVEHEFPTIIKSYDGKIIPKLNNIVSDNCPIGKMAAEHLLARGFREFAFCGRANLEWAEQRGSSFEEALEEAGFQTHFHKQPRIRGKRTTKKNLSIMVDWLKKLPKPLALLASDDAWGKYIISLCLTAGLQVPEEVAILGCDNFPGLCDLTNPPLSSIDRNFENIGYEAAELLHKMFQGEIITNRILTVLPTHVVIRQSTDILAINDSEVAKALAFIRRNAKQVIQVDDVVSSTCLSRRNLERHFRKALNRSLLGEIRRVRVNQIAEMLIETNQSILQIAMSLGFKNVGNITRYFRTEKKMSLLEFRSKFGCK